MRSALLAPLLCSLALGGEPVPSKFEVLRNIKWAGELSDPFSEQHEEARWENKLNSLPYERMQFYNGKATGSGPHVKAELRSVPKELLKTGTPEEVAQFRGKAAIAEAAESLSGAPGGPEWMGPWEGNDDDRDAHQGSPHSGDWHNDDDCGFGEKSCSTLPTEFSWYAFHGKGLITAQVNQHNPYYCGASWLFAGAAMLNDRIKISRAANEGGLGPDVEMAVQSVLNCGKRIAGTCESGAMHGVWTYINDASGVPFSTCENYVADDTNECTPRDICLSCIGSAECYGVPSVPSMDPSGYGFWMNGVPKIYIGEWGYIGTLVDNSVRDLELEIVTRGPIACAINGDPLKTYKKGIVDVTWDDEYNHYVEVIGYGTDDGTEFWHIRNSWGEFWGERGFGRVKRNVNSIGIEGLCSWVTPFAWGTFDESYGSNLDAAKYGASSKKKHTQKWAKEVSGKHCGGEYFPCTKNKQGSNKDANGTALDQAAVEGGDDDPLHAPNASRGTYPLYGASEQGTHSSNYSGSHDVIVITGDAGSPPTAELRVGGVVAPGTTTQRKIGSTFLEQILSQAKGGGAFWNADIVENFWKRGLPDGYLSPDEAAAAIKDPDIDVSATATDTTDASSVVYSEALLPKGAPGAVDVDSTAAAAAPVELAAAVPRVEATIAPGASPSFGEQLTMAAVGVFAVAGVASGFISGRRFERRHGGSW